MKKLLIPIVICAACLPGCSSTILGQSSYNVSAASGIDAKKVPTTTAAVETSTQADAPTSIRLPNDQIDFQHLQIDCDVSKEIITVKQGDKVVRSFPTSSGMDTIPDNTTPLGTFYIQPEKGTWFYSEQYQEGAKYWVSWSGHGVFLFHSVVMDKNGNIKQDELKKLGTKASHGCFRIPLEDAKWIYDNIPVGTKVIVHK